MLPRFNHPLRAAALLLALVGTLACALSVPSSVPDAVPTEPETDGAPVIELAAPVDGAAYAEDVGVTILARVTNAGEDIDRVEIVVDEAVVSAVPAPNLTGAPTFTISQTWAASGNGQRTLSVTVFRTDGSASQTVSRTIEIVSDEPVVVDASDGTATDGSSEPTASGEGGGSVFGGLFGGDNNTDATSPTTAPPTASDSETTTTEEDAAAPLPTSTIAPTTAPPTTEPSPVPATPRGTLLVGANVRSGPGVVFGRIGSYAQGTETDLLGVTSDRSWYKVSYYNADGWIAAELLSVTNADNLPIDEGPPPPTPTPIPPTPVPATAAPTAAPSNRNLTFADIPQGFAPYPPECGQTMAITLRVRNTGTEALGTSSAAVVRDIHIDSGTATETTIPIPDIGPGDSIEVTGGFLTVSTNFDTRHRIEIVLDSNNQIAESNENDNVFAGGLEYTLARGSC